MAKFAVGDRVRIKAWGAGDGHTGTVVQIKRRPSRIYYVELDGTVLGHSMLRLSKMNLQHLSEPVPQSDEPPPLGPYIDQPTLASTALPPPGWYVDDPNGAGLLRWWDGEGWTEHRQPW